MTEPLATRLRFHGRYAAETQEQCAIRKNAEREEAAGLIEHLRVAIKRHCAHLGRTYNAGGWHCPECDMRGPADPKITS